MYPINLHKIQSLLETHASSCNVNWNMPQLTPNVNCTCRQYRWHFGVCIHVLHYDLTFVQIDFYNWKHNQMLLLYLLFGNMHKFSIRSSCTMPACMHQCKTLHLVFITCSLSLGILQIYRWMNVIYLGSWTKFKFIHNKFVLE